MEPAISDDLESIPRWYFAVGGLQTQQARIELNRAIGLHRLRSFPRPEDLAQSLRDLPTAGAVAHYGEEAIQHELVVAADFFEDYDHVVKTAALVMAALRIRTSAEVFCPAVCERSWDTLCGVVGNRCRAHRVEQVMSGHQSSSPHVVTTDDMEWVARALSPLATLTTIPETRDDRFATAVEALCSYLHAGTYRMMAAQLWAGIEAIFDVQHEVSFRISALAARLLEPPGPRCRQLYKEVKELYNERSKAIHGKKVNEELLRQHVVRVRALLSRLLGNLLARAQLPSKEDFDDLLFLPDSRERSGRDSI